MVWLTFIPTLLPSCHKTNGRLITLLWWSASWLHQACELSLPSSFFLIIIMFLFREQQYPKASEIHEETDLQIKYTFLSFAPREEFEKLSLDQVEFLFDIACFMPCPNNLARPYDDAMYLLVIREQQILLEEEMRKKGIEPAPKKEEVSFLSRLASKVANFFKPSRLSNNSLTYENIQAPLRQISE